jgi:hypothetical protein
MAMQIAVLMVALDSNNDASRQVPPLPLLPPLPSSARGMGVGAWVYPSFRCID